MLSHPVLFGSGTWIRTGDTSGMNRMLWPTELRRHKIPPNDHNVRPVRTLDYYTSSRRYCQPLFKKNFFFCRTQGSDKKRKKPIAQNDRLQCYVFVRRHIPEAFCRQCGKSHGSCNLSRFQAGSTHMSVTGSAVYHDLNSPDIRLPVSFRTSAHLRTCYADVASEQHIL